MSKMQRKFTRNCEMFMQRKMHRPTERCTVTDDSLIVSWQQACSVTATLNFWISYNTLHSRWAGWRIISYEPKIDLFIFFDYFSCQFMCVHWLLTKVIYFFIIFNLAKHLYLLTDFVSHKIINS